MEHALNQNPSCQFEAFQFLTDNLSDFVSNSLPVDKSRYYLECLKIQPLVVLFLYETFWAKFPIQNINSNHLLQIIECQKKQFQLLIDTEDKNNIGIIYNNYTICVSLENLLYLYNDFDLLTGKYRLYQDTNNDSFKKLLKKRLLIETRRRLNYIDSIHKNEIVNLLTTEPKNLRYILNCEFDNPYDTRNIYEKEFGRLTWINALNEITCEGSRKYIPYLSESDTLDKTPTKGYYQIINIDIVQRIIYGKMNKSSIFCNNPSKMKNFFIFLRENKLMKISNDEIAKLIRILFNLNPKFHARYPFEIPKFEIENVKIFSTHIKGALNLLFNHGIISGSKRDAARIFTKIFPFDGLSYSNILKSLRPSSPIHFQLFSQDQLLAATGVKKVKNKIGV